MWKEEISLYKSALAFVRHYNFKESRNKHECEVLALSLDEMVKERIPMSSLSFEIQLRRLLGVRWADEFKEWHCAEALAWKSTTGVQNRNLLRAILKDSKLLAEIKKPPKTTTAAQSFKKAGRGGGRNAGRGGRGGGRNAGRGGDKPSSSGAAASS